ncbi:hypothetical protein THRCLA_10102 [Thraustotheca clavata]|uniref:Uncharacterized protein n=1 Tax=Thraustotheca clavata TaxID=74557 RepID=A0A1V9YSY5_9STRA|nr:hypothetical protein THRCLA_10102 [Thraustotheca clavata]
MSEDKQAPDIIQQFQLQIENRVSSLLDSQAYFPLHQVQNVLEKEFNINLTAHTEWLQQLIFLLSKQKLQQINAIALMKRQNCAASTLQCTYRRQKKRNEAKYAADRVAKQAIYQYAIDVIARFLLIRIRKQRVSREQHSHAIQILNRILTRWVQIRREALTRKKISSGLVPMRPRTKKPHTITAVTRLPEFLPPVKVIKRYDRLCKTCLSPHHSQCSRSKPSWVVVPVKPTLRQSSNQERSKDLVPMKPVAAKPAVQLPRIHLRI